MSNQWNPIPKSQVNPRTLPSSQIRQQLPGLSNIPRELLIHEISPYLPLQSISYIDFDPDLRERYVGEVYSRINIEEPWIMAVRNDNLEMLLALLRRRSLYPRTTTRQESISRIFTTAVSNRAPRIVGHITRNHPSLLPDNILQNVYRANMGTLLAASRMDETGKVANFILDRLFAIGKVKELTLRQLRELILKFTEISPEVRDKIISTWMSRTTTDRRLPLNLQDPLNVEATQRLLGDV